MFPHFPPPIMASSMVKNFFFSALFSTAGAAGWLGGLFAFGLPLITGVMLLALPWLVPLFSKAMYVMSDLIVVIGTAAVIVWRYNITSMTNLELLLGMLFFGWFVVFSRQIAALEADRIQEQIMHVQLMSEQGMSMLASLPESRLASDR